MKGSTTSGSRVPDGLKMFSKEADKYKFRTLKNFPVLLVLDSMAENYGCVT